MVPLVRWALPKDENLARLAYGLYPSEPDSPAWLAAILPSKEPEESLELFQEAAALDPLNNTLWEQTGTLAQRLKHDDIAINANGKACAIYPARRDTCINAAELSYNAGSWDQVIRYFELGSMPKTSADWVLLIKAARKLGRDADAATFLAQAKEVAPADYSTLLAQQP
jgi:tetratricopeptide (TPR) repeat protein